MAASAHIHRQIRFYSLHQICKKQSSSRTGLRAAPQAQSSQLLRSKQKVSELIAAWLPADSCRFLSAPPFLGRSTPVCCLPSHCQCSGWAALWSAFWGQPSYIYQQRMLCLIFNSFLLLFIYLLLPLPALLSALPPPHFPHISSPSSLVSSEEHKVPKLAPDQSDLHSYLQKSHKSAELQHVSLPVRALSWHPALGAAKIKTSRIRWLRIRSRPLESDGHRDEDHSANLKQAALRSCSKNSKLA